MLSSSSRLVNVLAQLFLGIGIGWLMGLSVSPLVGTIVTTVVGSAITLTAALSTLVPIAANQNAEDERPGYSRTPLPLALLVIGIVMGCMPAIYVRTHNLLGIGVVSNASPTDESQRTVLFGYGVTEDECKAWRGDLIRGELRSGMASAKQPSVRKFVNKVNDQALEAALEELLCPSPQTSPR